MKKNANCMCTNCTCEKPMANLTINKGRMKTYDKDSESPTYYLKDGQEFELELFNPKTNNVLVKIKLNGDLISKSGVVLKPGQRVFLDRYIDVSKKFKFETYEVGNSDAVKKAIQNNGTIEFLFYDEQFALPEFKTTIQRPFHYWGGLSDLANRGYQPQVYYSNSNIGTNDMSFTTTSFSNNVGNDVALGTLRSVKSSKSMETGRIEKGDDSNQEFTTIDISFSNLTTHTIKYKLLPISTKNVEVGELKRYCTQCGATLKKTHKFCAQCGAKG